MKLTQHHRVSLILACSIAGWAFVCNVLLPGLVATMYAGNSFPILNQMISGRSLYPLNFYLAKIRYCFLVGLCLQAAAALPFLLAPRGLPVWRAIRTAWIRYWFRPTPTIYLGIARVVCVGAALALMLPSSYGHFNQ